MAPIGKQATGPVTLLLVLGRKCPQMGQALGTSQNALLIQIWTALIAMLLLKWLHHLSKARWSFSNLASMLRLNLFTYRDLRRWLENPFGTPPLVPLAEQLTLNLG